MIELLVILLSELVFFSVSGLNFYIIDTITYRPPFITAAKCHKDRYEISYFWSKNQRYKGPEPKRGKLYYFSAVHLPCDLRVGIQDTLWFSIYVYIELHI